MKKAYNNIPSVTPQVGSGRVGCTLTVPLPLRGKKVVSDKPLFKKPYIKKLERVVSQMR